MGLIAGIAAAYGFLRWRPFRVEVRGPSMRPTLEPGDWAIAIVRQAVRRGDVVVLEHPDRPGYEIVKRVVRGPGEMAPGGATLTDSVWVEGDDRRHSTDSRRFGSVPIDLVRARVRLIVWPPGRFRLV